jgi:hypothetical protein
LREASARGRVDVVALLLRDGRADPAAGASHSSRFSLPSSACLILASKNGHAEVVSLLLQDTRADPAAGGILDGDCIESSACLVLASQYSKADSADSHAKIVSLLLHDGRADPSACLKPAMVQ